jgi:hypothetical protein
MNRAMVVDEDELERERRKATFAYIASFIAQIVAFGMGWLACANWPQIIGRFA